MKNRHLIFAAMTILAAVSGENRSLVADDSGGGETPLPDGPLLNVAPDFSTWQITFSYASDKPSAAGKAPPAPLPPPPGILSTLPPRTITVIRTKPLWHAEIIDTAGWKMDQWDDGASRYYIASGSPPRFVPNGYGSDPKFTDFTTASFPNMDWISAATYVGTAPMDSHKCMVFSKGDMKAWIDLETRFPVRWQRTDAETRTFRRLSPPDDKLILPSSISKISAAIQHDRDVFMRHAAPN
jgi:hypothetical protein